MTDEEREEIEEQVRKARAEREYARSLVHEAIMEAVIPFREIIARFKRGEITKGEARALAVATKEGFMARKDRLRN